MDEIIETFEIGKMILPDIPEKLTPTSQTYTDMLLAIGKKGLKITVAEPGSRYSLGGAELTILGPLREYSDLNNSSVVAWLQYEDTGFVFTGDIEADAEQDILEARPDIYAKAVLLDAAHHGSKSSSTKAFLQWLGPSTAVLSCGVDNSYGHPSRDVVERLSALETAVYRTDLDGVVVAVSDGTSIEVHTQK